MGNTNVKPHPKPRNKKQLRWKGADRPSPPGKPSLNQENGFIPNVVQIHWTKPEKEGGSTVTSYLIEHKRFGTTHWLKSSQHPVTTNELAVNDLEPGWRYQFRVRAENAVGLSDPSEISEPYTVTLQRLAITAPKFTQELNDSVILENGKVEFEVHFLGQPQPNICWFKDGFEIFSGNRTRVTTLADKSILSIFHATAADEGEIKCTATNKAGHASTKSRLTIEATPSIKLPKSYQDTDGIIFEIGETIKLNVTVSGRPTPLIFWSHDGESIQNNDRYEIEYNDKIASVKIENALRTDRGEYQVKAVNKLGHDQASFLVTITDKPTPPGKARVLLTSGRSVTLSWSTPEDDGGCRIGNYIIEYYRLGWNVWLKAATTRQLSTMLGDLIEGSQYKFRVKAESPYGVSDPSEETEVVFIADPKRGIREPADVRVHENESHIPLPNRRRAMSSPRVSFALNEDVPVRPERKKTGRTPEASPRMKRKQISSLTKNIKSLGSEPFLNRNFSRPVQVSTSSKSDSPLSLGNSPTSPLRKQVAFNYPGMSVQRMTPENYQREKNKSPSPEIVITDTDVDRGSKFLKESKNTELSEKSLSRTPNEFRKSPSVSPQPGRSINYIVNSPPRNPNQLDKSPPRIPNFEKSLSRSPIPLEKSPPRSPKSPEKSPSRSPNSSEKSSSPNESYNKKSPSPGRSYSEKSPPRNVTNFERSPPNSPSKTPDGKRHSLTGNMQLDLKDIYATADAEFGKKDKSPSPQILDRIRPTLTHQAFSGSSEFMLVLCPEEEQGSHFRKFDIDFEDSSIPPPLSLSAPELGIEPPELPQLKRSASSTELLTYRLMERLHEAVMRQEDASNNPNKGQLSIPTIQVNSQPTQDIPENPSLSRRLSGVLPGNQSSWSNRRYSLKNAKEISGSFGTKLHKFENTPDIRRELSEYRKISESEDEKVEKMESNNEEEWMKDYEESISEEDSEGSSAEDQEQRPKITNAVQLEDDTEEEEEMYNPRNRMMSAVKADSNQPFEILTVRKDPPSPNIIPKPILKKTAPSNSENKRLSVRTTKSSISQDLQKDYLTTKRRRSNSLTGALDEEMDVSQIKTSPTPNRRRSFSLIPTNANFIKDAFKTNTHKEVVQSPKPSDGTKKNVSALASFTSIAGAGLIIPKKMQEKKEADEEIQDKKETQEEAKVVVDFYGDIVKSFGGKSKPTAEFSRTIVSKYDTYEERKISEIKPNLDSLASGPQNIKTMAPKSTLPDTRGYTGTKSFSPTPVQSSGSMIKQEPVSSKQSGTLAAVGYGKSSPAKPIETYFDIFPPRQEDKLVRSLNTDENRTNKTRTQNIDPPVRDTDDIFKRMKHELTQSKMSGKSPLSYKQDMSPIGNRGLEKSYRDSRSSSRQGSRQSSVGRRKRTPMSRDASTSPVRFSNDWDSLSSSRNSLERDYYNRGSLTSSRASSVSRRSLSPPRPRSRAITTQTSFGMGLLNQDDAQQKDELTKKADKRMKVGLEYLTDLSMISVAAVLYVFHHEYYAIPFLLILIFRQLGEKVQKMNEAMKKWIPQWIRNRFGRKS